MSRPLAVAITGGIGAGKSEALAAFARHGAADPLERRDRPPADRARTGRCARPCSSASATAFSTRAADLDRNAIAEIVFADRDELAWLEGLLHPRVAQEYAAWREELERLPDPPAACVTEIPLLYETGGEGRFDAVVVVTASPELRARRAQAPPERREARLIPDEEKASQADFVYVNDGTLEELDAFVGRRPAGSARQGAEERLVLLAVGAVARRRLRLRPLDRARAGTSGSGTRSATRQIVRGHARNYRLDPALLAAVIYQESKFDAACPLELGRDRPDAAPARDREGDRRPHGRLAASASPTSTTPRSTSATARGTCGTCSTSTATSAPRWPPTTRGRTTSTAGAAEGDGDPVPGDAALRRPRRAPEGDLPARVRLGAARIRVILDSCQ